MSDPTRGITDADMRKVIRTALDNGWEWMGMSGTTHGCIRWPATGDLQRFAFTPSVASWKTVATEVQRISKVDVWRKGNRKRSRKKLQTSGFNLSYAVKETSQWHARTDERVDLLLAERAQLIGRCYELARSADRGDLQKLPDVWRRITRVEECLQHLGAPATPFDPHCLQGSQHDD